MQDRLSLVGVHLGPDSSAPPDVRRPPLGLGMVWAYARARLGGDYQFDLTLPFVTRVQDLEAVLATGGRHVVLFSDYIWNAEGNLAASRRVKELDPRAITVHGGPNVPSYPAVCEKFLRREAHIDYAIRGEGEKALVDLLRALARGDANSDVPASASTLVCGRFVRGPDRERTEDLDELPSPYLSGLFDGLFASEPFGFATIETNRGCPYGCVYCDWGAATLQKIRTFSLERVRSELEWLGSHRIFGAWIVDANFGILPRDIEIARLVVATKKKFGFPGRLVTNYAKNTQRHLVEIIETFVDAGIISSGVISVQTRDERTLATVHRKNIKTREYDALRDTFVRRGLPLATQLMIGLPGATVRSLMADLSYYFDEPVEVQVSRTVLLPNSPMAEPSYQERYRVVAGDDALVTSTASMSEADFRLATLIVRQYTASHHFGVLRYPLVFLRREHSLDPVDVMHALAGEEGTLRSRFPRLWDLLEVAGNPFDLFDTHGAMLERYRAGGMWPALLDEFAAWVAGRFGVVRGAALGAVLEAQAAVLPAAGRAFPHEVSLPHDVVAWYADGRLSGAEPRALASYGPGVLTVEDPLGFSSRPYVLQRATRLHWELASALALARVGRLGALRSSDDGHGPAARRDLALPWAMVAPDAAAS